MNRALYENWLRTAGEHGNAFALFDAALDRRWTFAELAAAVENGGEPDESVVFPRGQGAEFVVSVLRAWRWGKVVCPLEIAQPAPIAADIRELPDGCAHLKITSATSGAPKCIAFTAAQLAADAANIVATMGLRTDWPNIGCISLAHSYGFSNLITPLALHGIPLVILPAPLPELLRRAAEKFDGVTLPAVPALWRTWAESKCIPRNVKLAISAGAPLPLELERQIYSETGIKLHNFYGSSECGGIAYDRSDTPRTEADLAGSAMENVTLALGPAGTLIVESEAVGQTYWPEPRPNLRAPRFETLDLAEITADGVYLRGRASDVINVAGRKVAPEMIEAALRGHPLVRECVVFGILARDRAERIIACVHAARGLSAPECVSFLSSKLPAWQIPRQWWFTEQLGVNERGKISRAEWRRRFLEHDAFRKQS